VYKYSAQIRECTYEWFRPSLGEKEDSDERWVGYVLPASALWVALGTLVVAPGGPAGNLAVNLLSNLGPVLLLIGLGYLGFRAWAERAPAKHVGPGADG